MNWNKSDKVWNGANSQSPRREGKRKKTAPGESRVRSVACDSRSALFFCLPSLCLKRKATKFLAGFQPITFHCEKDWKKCANTKWKKNSKLTVFIINMGVQKMPRLHGYMKVIWKALTHRTTIWRKDLEYVLDQCRQYSGLLYTVRTHGHHSTEILMVSLYPLSHQKKMVTMSCMGKQSVLPPFEFTPLEFDPWFRSWLGLSTDLKCLAFIHC